MLDQLAATLDALSPSEKRVGQLVIDNPRRFVAMSTTAIANACCVSKPTIFRFCKGLGYVGLAQFKQKLRGDGAGGVPCVHSSVDAGDTPFNVAVKVVDSSIAALLHFRNQLPQKSIAQISHQLVKAYADHRTVSFYGAGHSGVVAQDAQLRFSRLGFNAAALTDGYAQMLNAASRKAGDIVIALSCSGRTKELLESVDVARQQGATVMAVTGTGTPLAAIGSMHLATDHLEDMERYMPMSSRLLHLVVIDVVSTAVALQMGCTQLQDQLQKTQNHLRQRRFA
jgi:RpiR family carbohydrate utilization transcriptional regulator